MSADAPSIEEHPGVAPAAARADGTLTSVVVPVYGNEGSLPELLRQLADIDSRIGPLEGVFVVDGSPDDSLRVLAELLPTMPFASQLVAHSRNFGALAAVKTGLDRARGEYCAVIAADLQEPPELIEQFHAELATGDVDIVVGVRRSREDPLRDRLPSQLFWGLYRRTVQREIPRGGVDVFGCNRAFLDQLRSLEESNTSLVGLIYWLGFRRSEVVYARAERVHGKSGWTFKNKLRYLSDSVFAFTDLPIRLLTMIGGFGVLVSIVVSMFVIVARLAGLIDVPGYAGTLLVVSFFSALNLFGIGIMGSYVWRAFENTKQRPGAVVMHERQFPADRKGPA